MRKDQDLERTRRILRGWGVWSNNNTGCGWYTEMPGLKNVLPKETKYQTDALGDDDALVIDKMVACMHDKKDERPMTFFSMSYVYNWNNCDIAKAMNCSEKTVREAIMLMETFISGMLSQRYEMGFKLEFDK